MTSENLVSPKLHNSIGRRHSLLSLNSCCRLARISEIIAKSMELWRLDSIGENIVKSMVFTENEITYHLSGNRNLQKRR